MTIGKNNKEVDFSAFLIKRFIKILVIAFLIVTTSLGVAMPFAWANASARDMYEFSAVKASILDSNFANGDTKTIEYYTALYSSYHMEQYTGIEKAVVVTEKDTGKIVATSEFTMFAIVKDHESEQISVFTCRDKAVVDFVVENSNVNTYLEFDSIYIKDDEFIPSVVSVYSFDETDPMVDGELIAKKDFTPADTAGYTHYTDKCLNIAGGTLRDSELLSIVANAVDGKEFSNAVTALDEAYYTRGSTDFINYDEFMLNGKEYAVYSLAIFDFWKVYTSAVVGSYIGMLVLAVMIAVISSFVSYAKYSADYEAEEYRRSMVDALSHDLKTPLMAISGYAENMKSGAHPEKAEYYTDAILDNVNYMNDIIASVLQLSKLENGCRLVKEQLDVVEIARELYEKYAPIAEERGISCKISGGCTVSADRKLLTQAIENLIANAVKYTSDGGSISITADNKSLEFTNTCDSALSLDCAELCKPLSKGDSSRTKNSGTGMGLSIVKRICELHRFKLDVNAQNGTFTARLKF